MCIRDSLKGDINIMHDAELEKDVLKTAARSGMVDMYGWQIPSIDGFDLTDVYKRQV